MVLESFLLSQVQWESISQKEEIHLQKKTGIKVSDITHPEDPPESCINATATAWFSSRADFGVHTAWTSRRISGKPFISTTAIQLRQAKRKIFQLNKSFLNFEIMGRKIHLVKLTELRRNTNSWVPHLFRPHKRKHILELFNHAFQVFHISVLTQSIS